MAKTALILGGTRGLGLALAWDAYYFKFNPIIAGRSIYDKKVRATFPPGSEFLKLDFTDPESVEQLARRRPEPIDYIFWVAGNFHRGILDQMPYDKINKMIATHLSGPVRAIQLLQLGLHYILKHPYHFITIASISSWKFRENETLYCTLKAAKAAFTRNFAIELVRDLPGSKVTLVNPGGIKTGFFEGTEQDTSNFMDPKIVSRIIWNEVVSQKTPFHEVQIFRNDDGTPNVCYGPRMPEQPFQVKEIIIPEELKNKGILNQEQSEKAKKAFGFKE